MDLKVLIDALLTGTPIAILVALVGVVLQWTHMLSRERSQDRQAQRELNLEKQKFQHQQQLEEKKFEYEQRRWREQLGREITVKLLEVRLAEYAKVWSLLEAVAESQQEVLTPEAAQTIARQIKSWRYSKGGLLAEENTRDAAHNLQKALWSYDGTPEAYRRIRAARLVFRDAVRADSGLSQAIYQLTEERQRVGDSLKKFELEHGRQAEMREPEPQGER